MLATGLGAAAQKTTLLEKGIKSFEAGQKHEALNYFNQYLAKFPNSTAVRYNRAQVYFAYDSFELALNDLKASENDFVGNANFWQLKGRVLLKLEQYQEALGAFDKALELNFLDRDAFLNRGYCFFKLGFADKAVKDYDAALALDPSFPEAYYNRALAYRQQKNDSAALADLDKVIVLSPAYLKARLERANIYFEMGAYETAETDYSLYLEVYSDDALALNNRGLARSRNNDHVGAIDDFSEAVAIMPSRGRFYFNLATERFFIKDFEGAIDDFTMAIEKMEDPFEAYYFRGKLYYETKEYAKAIEDLKAAHQLQPDDRRATDLLFTARMVLFLSRYWLYLLAFIVLAINGIRLYRRNKTFAR